MEKMKMEIKKVINNGVHYFVYEDNSLSGLVVVHPWYDKMRFEFYDYQLNFSHKVDYPDKISFSFDEITNPFENFVMNEFKREMIDKI